MKHHRSEHRGFTLWFTGLSGAGKSTLSALVAREFEARGYAVELLDGDEVRTHLSAGLSFSRQDRDTNVARLGWICRLLNRHGVIAISAAISPFRAARDECRRLSEEAGHPFVEVYAACELEELVRRDVKGLYERALRGEIEQFTGVSDPYEEPLAPEIITRSDQESVQTSLERILRHLREAELIEVAPGAEQS